MKPVVIAALALLSLGARAENTTGLPFLPRPARTDGDLARQVLSTRRLQQRYARQFEATPTDVCAAVRSVAAAALPPGTYTVWLTTRDGLRYPTLQERDAPTPIFVLRLPSGLCFLEAGSGNPISVFRPVVQIVYQDEAPVPDTRQDESPVLEERLEPIGDSSARPPEGNGHNRPE